MDVKKSILSSLVTGTAIRQLPNTSVSNAVGLLYGDLKQAYEKHLKDLRLKEELTNE
tara:strand:- start:43 stop:213 length:171 start_codon:yes stop_codon:yes gene_type:complete